MNRTNTILLALAVLMATTVAMSACGSVCNHMDNDQNKFCDICGASLETSAETVAESDTETETEAETPAESETTSTVDVTLTVKDQFGNLIAGAALRIIGDGNETVAALTTEADGHAVVTLPEGNYSVIFDELPEYHLAETMPLTVTADTELVELEIINNTPDGSAAHPFFIDTATTVMTFAANQTYHYTMFAGDRRSIVIENAADIEITLNGTTHTPDETGLIRVPMSADQQQARMDLSVTSRIAQEVTITIDTEAGASDNPIVIEELGTLTVTVPKDTIMYYSYTVTSASELWVTSEDPTNNISLTNYTASTATVFTGGADTGDRLAADAGDVIILAVSIVGGESSAESYSLTFTLNGEAA